MDSLGPPHHLPQAQPFQARPKPLPDTTSPLKEVNPSQHFLTKWQPHPLYTQHIPVPHPMFNLIVLTLISHFRSPSLNDPL